MTEEQTFAEIAEKAKFYSRKNQRELAQFLGISPSYLSELVTGKKSDSEGKFAEKLLGLCDGEEASPKLETQGNPYFEDFTIQGGYGHGDGKEQALAPDGYMSVPGINRTEDIPFLRVRGQSMLNPNDPEHSIPPGSWVAVKKVIGGAIRWGEVYVVMTVDGPIVKRLMPSDKTDCVRCVSFNDDYPPFDLPIIDIMKDGIYIVKGVVNVQIWN